MNGENQSFCLEIVTFDLRFRDDPEILMSPEGQPGEGTNIIKDSVFHMRVFCDEDGFNAKVVWPFLRSLNTL